MNKIKFDQQFIVIGEKITTNSISSGEFKRVVKVKLPTDFGMFKLFAYENDNGIVCLAIVKGNVTKQSDVPVRLHSSCVTGDILGSLRCDCRKQLIKSLELIEKNKCGVVIYAFQEGRGIGLINKLKAYKLQEQGLDTIEANLALGLPADMREYGFIGQILSDLKIESIALMTNNPEKIAQLKDAGVKITSIMQLEIPVCIFNHKYLQTKKNKMGHLLSLNI